MALQKAYLICFNLTSFAGWTYIQYLWWKSIISSHTIPFAFTLYSEIMTPLFIMQSLQFIELLHTLLNITKSNLAVQVMQLFGRYSVLMLCLLYARRNQSGLISEESYLNGYLQYGYTAVVSAWSLAEIIRYPFYVFKLLGSSAYVLEWLRYNAFIVLYPIGFLAEMRCWYGLIAFFSTMSDWNNEIVLRLGFAISACLVTPFAGLYMYKGMLKARKKWIRSKSKNTKKD